MKYQKEVVVRCLKLAQFTFTDRGNKVDIVDARTGKTATVGIYALSDVKEALAALKL